MEAAIAGVSQLVRRQVSDLCKDEAEADEAFMSKPVLNWRDHLPVHPAADDYPLMSEAELKELADDIQENGLQNPIVICTPLSAKDIFETERRKRESLETKKKREANRKTWRLLDGRNRLDALAEITKRALLEKEQIGEAWGTFKADSVFTEDHLYLEVNEEGELCLHDAPIRETGESELVVVYNVDDEKAHALADSYNRHRRHLTAEQRRDVIAKRLKRKPETSNRQIAEQVKADHKTVGDIRSKLEATGEIPQLKETTGKDGKARKQPAKRKTKPDAATENTRPQEIADALNPTREASAEERTAHYAETEGADDDEQTTERRFANDKEKRENFRSATVIQAASALNSAKSIRAAYLDFPSFLDRESVDAVRRAAEAWNKLVQELESATAPKGRAA